MPLFGLPNSSGPDDPAGHALLLAIAFVAVIFVALVVAAIYSIRAIQAWNQAFAPDVADGAARELALDITYCPACGFDVSSEMPQPYGEPMFCERHERAIFQQIG